MSRGLRDLLYAAVVFAVAALAALATVASAATSVAGGSVWLQPAAATSSSTASLAPALPTSAIVLRDQTSLRAAPRDSAPAQALLAQGDVLEVRGERLEFLQVWDHRRERGGFVRASQVHRGAFGAADAAELRSLVRFVAESPGQEALGIGLVAAYLQAAPASDLRAAAGAEAFDALGTFADRLAVRASAGAATSASAAAALAVHLEVASGYGIRFVTFERNGRMQICYDGDAFRRVLALPAEAAQQARAALALTRPECVDPVTSPLARAALDAWRADVLDRVDVGPLPAYEKNRIAMRRAGVWSSIAYERARQSQPADAAARRALTELAKVGRSELADDDESAFNDAAMRVNASRWAASPAAIAITADAAKSRRGAALVTVAGELGETCVLLVDAGHDASAPLLRRCTYGIVWAASSSLSREGNALALAVQPLDGWRELWVFRKTPAGWAQSVLPPATTGPDLGIAEFAGWVPGGRQMLVARESRGEGRYRRSFEVVRIDTLATERQSPDASALGPFQRWPDPAWKRDSVAVR